MKQITLFILLALALSLPSMGVVHAQEAAYVIDTTIPVEPALRSDIDAWLAGNAPIPLPYWAITYVAPKGLDTFVSLTALDLATADEAWHATDSNQAVWMGSVIVHEDGSVEMYATDVGAQASALKLAMPDLTGGGSAYNFPWSAGGTMMYGPRGVHDAGGGSYADGMYAVDFVGGDDMGSGVANNNVYAVALGTVDYVCADDTTTLVRTHNAVTDDYFIYAHLLDNVNLAMDHAFSRGALIGATKYGTFDDSCGYADQTAKHYHLHFGFEFGSGYFRLENCILSQTTEKWTCGTQTVSMGQFLKGGGGLGHPADDTGMNVDQPSFWDYVVTGAVSLWDKTIIQNMPTHKTMQYTYVIYSTVKLMLKLARVMVYSNLNLGHLFAVMVVAIGIKIAFGIAEFIVFLFKAWKSLVPIIGA